jgi:hypothetical protein
VPTYGRCDVIFPYIATVLFAVPAVYCYLVVYGIRKRKAYAYWCIKWFWRNPMMELLFGAEPAEIREYFESKVN